MHTYGVLLATGFFCAVTWRRGWPQHEWRKVVWVDGKGFVDTEGPRRREQMLDLGSGCSWAGSWAAACSSSS